MLARAQDGPGLTGADSYESPTYGYEVTWSDDWAAVPGSTTSENDRDTLTLDSGSAIRVQVIGVDPETDLEDLLASMVEPIAKGFPDAEVTELDSEADELATVIEFTIGDQPAIQRMEARLLPSGDAAIGVRHLHRIPICTRRRLRMPRTSFSSTATRRSRTCPASPMTAVRTIRATTRATTNRKIRIRPDRSTGTPARSSTGGQPIASTSPRSRSTPPRSTAAHGRSTTVGTIDTVDEIAQLAADARGVTDEDEVESIEQSYEEWDWQRNYHCCSTCGRRISERLAIPTSSR